MTLRFIPKEEFDAMMGLGQQPPVPSLEDRKTIQDFGGPSVYENDPYKPTGNAAVDFVNNPDKNITQGRFSYLLNKTADLTDKVLAPVSNFMFGSLGKVAGTYGMGAWAAGQYLGGNKEGALETLGKIEENMPTTGETIGAGLQAISLYNAMAGGVKADVERIMTPERGQALGEFFKLAKEDPVKASKKLYQDTLDKLTFKYSELTKNQKLAASNKGLLKDPTGTKDMLVSPTHKTEDIAKTVQNIIVEDTPNKNIARLRSFIDNTENDVFEKMGDTVFSSKDATKAIEKAIKSDISVIADPKISAKGIEKSAKAYANEIVSKSKTDKLVDLAKSVKTFAKDNTTAIETVVKKGNDTSVQNRMIKVGNDAARKFIDSVGGKEVGYSEAMTKMHHGLEAIKILDIKNLSAPSKSVIKRVAGLASKLPVIGSLFKLK